LDNFEKHLTKQDSGNARHELAQFEKKLDHERQETMKHEEKGHSRGNRFISADAYTILKEDISLLLEQLPSKR